MEDWVSDYFEQHKQMAARHEAGHALMALLEKQPIWEYDLTNSRIISASADKVHFIIEGGVVYGDEDDDKDEPPESSFRMAIAGPAAEPIFRKLTPDDLKNEISDYEFAAEALRTLAQRQNVPLSNRRIGVIIHRNHKVLRNLFSGETSYSTGVDILMEHMLSNGKDNSPDITNQMLAALHEGGIDMVVMTEMRNQIATTIDPNRDLQEKWGGWLRWLPA